MAKAAEDGGWDGFFLWDHLHFVRAMQLDIVDPWVTLGAIAHATSRLRIGAMVTPLPRRRPWKLAKEIVTLDHLSAGRVIVGVGLGFPPDDEFAAFGEPSDNASRAALLDEGLVVLEGCLRGGGFRHQGPAYNVDVDLHPRTDPAATPADLGSSHVAESPADRQSTTLRWVVPHRGER